jgi:kinesin family protein 3/17
VATKEKNEGQGVIVDVNEISKTIRIDNPAGGDVKPFTFDYVYGMTSQQSTVFTDCARPLVENVLEGYNGTMFAYGQTGTGKTFTMEGVPGDENLRGIMPNSFVHVFEAVKNAGENQEFLVRASFLEIYQDNVYDLLNSKARPKMQLKEDKDKGVFVKDLATFVVKSVADCFKILARGQKMRSVGATKMNAGSSRSHSILSLTIETSETLGGETAYKVGKLNLVDLAGSERQKKTEAAGDRLAEAKSINLSLSALGNVIKALVDPKAKHVPFRDSKLTRLLQDSLGGNTKTVMVAAIGPCDTNFDETMSTLRYANRAKNIKNKPKINEDPKDAMLRQFQEEIAMLRAQLEAKRKGMSMEEYMKLFGGKSSGGGGGGGGGGSELEVEENIIEKVVYEDTGISEADLERRRNMNEKELAAWKAQHERDKQRLENEARAAGSEAEERERLLQAKLAHEEEEQALIEKLEEQLKSKEEQIQVGQVERDEAIRQKAELKKTEREIDQRRTEEERLKAELEAAEEAELYMNEHCASTDELMAKTTKKLKALWSKCDERKAELGGLEEEFELERADYADSIRDLDRTLKLKQLILDTFAPPRYIEMVEARAMWSDFQDSWHIPGLELAGNNVNLLEEEMPHEENHFYRRQGDDEYGKQMWMQQHGSPGGSAGAGTNGDAMDDFALNPDMEAALHAAMRGDNDPMNKKNMFLDYEGKPRSRRRDHDDDEQITPTRRDRGDERGDDGDDGERRRRKKDKRCKHGDYDDRR